MVGVGQEFPPHGARDGLSRSQAEEARAASAELREVTREVWAEVARACTSWSAAEALRDRLASHRALLAEMSEAMLARYETGGETLGVVTRADAELAAAERHVAEAEEEVAVARANLLALAGEDVSLPADPPPLPRPRAQLELEPLVELAASRGSLEVAQAGRRSAQAQADAAVAEAKWPTFEVRATYMQTPSMRPGLGAMVAMSLPWLWGGGSHRREAARFETEAAGADAASAIRAVRVEVTRAAGQVRALSRALELLTEREIPAARQALEAERAALAAGDFNLASWIQAAHALREAHVDEARMRGALGGAWIDLESSVGRPLPEVTTTEEEPR